MSGPRKRRRRASGSQPAQDAKTAAGHLTPSPEENLAEIAKLVKSERKARGWTVQELSRRTNRLSAPYIYQIESFAKTDRARREPIRLSLDALHDLALALDLDIYQLVALADPRARTRTSPGLLKELRDYITRMLQAMRRLDITILSLLEQEPVEIDAPRRLSEEQLQVNRGDHILLFVASPEDRLLSLPLLNAFLEKQPNREREGVVVFLRKDTALDRSVSPDESYRVDDDAKVLLSELLSRCDTADPGELPRALLYDSHVITPEKLKNITQLSRQDIKRYFDPAGEYFRRSKQGFARWLFEDSSASLAFIGSERSAAEAAGVRRQFLEYERHWAEDVGRWAHPVSSPILLCQYVGTDLRAIADDHLPLARMIFELLRAHDVVWVLPRGAGSFPPGKPVLLTGAAAVRWLLEEYVFSVEDMHSSPTGWWQELDWIATKFRIWSPPVTSG